MSVKVCLILAVVAALASCRQSRPREVAIDVPAMGGTACGEIVSNAVVATDGVYRDSVRLDLTQRKVNVRFDSMRVAVKNIEHAIADAGFDANTIPGREEARARLPADCR